MHKDFPMHIQQIKIYDICLLPCCVSPKLPKYALANKLYLGDLPEEFKDLTWVEDLPVFEKRACSLNQVFSSFPPCHPSLCTLHMHCDPHCVSFLEFSPQTVVP